MKSIEEVFLATKEVFIKQATEAMENVMEKVYAEYLPHVETDTQLNVFFLTQHLLKCFFEGTLTEGDGEMPIFKQYTCEAGRKKAVEENPELFNMLVINDLNAKIKQLESVVAYFQHK